MSRNQEHAVSIRIIGDGLDPNEITKLLNIEPSEAHKKGDENVKKSKSGKLMVFSPFDTGLWAYSSCEDKEVSLESHIKCLLTVFEPSWEKLKDICNRGYRIDLFCGVFSSSNGQTGISIGHDIIKKLSEVNISIDICYY